MKQTIEISFNVPHMAYELKIQKMYRRNNKLIVVYMLEDTLPKGACGLPTISTVEASDLVDVDEILPVTHYVIGVNEKDWFYDKKKFTAIKNTNEIPELKNPNSKYNLFSHIPYSKSLVVISLLAGLTAVKLLNN